MFLGEEEIRRLIREKQILAPVEEGQIQPAGVDLRIDELYVFASSGKLEIQRRDNPSLAKVSPNREGKYEVLPRKSYVFSTIEEVNMPLNLLGVLFPRSTLIRSGVIIGSALVDPGYVGKLHMLMFNSSEFPFEVERGARVAQISFSKVEGISKGYSGYYQGGRVI
ncbi:dCTP deaminase [Thermococci archaeon]|nr:MAG: dCTP deaminase [Thermococci archaeon]